MNGQSSLAFQGRAKVRFTLTSEVLANVAAVDAGLKPSYLFDRAFLSSDAVDKWLSRISDELRPTCSLSVLNVEGQLFVVDVDRIRNRLMDMVSGDGSNKGILVDVSCGLKQPRLWRTADSMLIVKQCAQAVYEHIKSSGNRVYCIELPPSVNRTTLYGVLLGYPVIYWYDDAADGYDGGSCLSMTPLVVTTATVTFDLKGHCNDGPKKCEIYSFSIPEALFKLCQEPVDTWCNQITRQFEQRRSVVQRIQTLHFDHRIVVQPAVCL